MKHSPASRGFTLIELLVVITIIAILAGLTLGISGNVRQKAAVGRAQVEIAAIETALERYKIDNGDYPNATQAFSLSVSDTFLPTTSGNPSASGYLNAGKALFAAIMGRALYDSAVTSGQVQYLELKKNQTQDNSGASYIIDPFGYAYGYYYNAAGIGSNSTVTTGRKSLFNQVVPDIWSTAGETGNIENPYNSDGTLKSPSTTNGSRFLRWVTNWGSRQ